MLSFAHQHLSKISLEYNAALSSSSSLPGYHLGSMALLSFSTVFVVS
jgi:hypothetical protein